MKKFVSILLLMAFAMTLMASGAFAAGTTMTIGTASNVKASDGTVTVNVTISGNPGISSGRLLFNCDLPLTVTRVGFVSENGMTISTTLSDGRKVEGVNMANGNVAGEVVLVTLTVDVSGAEAGKTYPITFVNEGRYTTYLYDMNVEKISDLSFVAGSVTMAAEPTPAPTAEPTPAPTAEPTPAPTAEPTPEPTAEPTPAPTAEPTPEPTAEPTPAPTAEPTPEPTAEPTPTTEPVKPTDEPTPTDKPVDPSTKPSDKPTSDKSHKTGEDFIALWTILFVVAGAAVVIVTHKKKEN